MDACGPGITVELQTIQVTRVGQGIIIIKCNYSNLKSHTANSIQATPYPELAELLASL